MIQGDYYSQNGLGFMYLHAYGKPQNVKKAAEYFDAAASQDFAPAQVNLGKILLEQGDHGDAIKYFELAARHGNVESYYYLAEIYNSGKGRERSCGMATAYYKIVAERIEAIHSPFEWANKAFQEGDVESALVGYMMAAEQGYESAQQNVAFILDDQKSRLPLLDLLNLIKTKTLRLGGVASSTPAADESTSAKPTPEEQARYRNRELALIYYTRSAKQANIDSLVKMGDYYLSGIGTELDHEKAAACYQAASEFQQSAQALWNLGWMHENGVGVEQDFHLAKRFYDLALETNPSEAYIPVVLSLAKLRVRGWWNRISGGGVNDIGPPEADGVGGEGAKGKKERKKWSLKEFLKKWNEEVDAVNRAQEEAARIAEEAERAGLEGDGGVFGGGGEGDADAEGLGVAYDGHVEGGEEPADEEMVESVLIMVLATSVVLLILYRQQRIMRDRQQQQQQGGGGGEGLGLGAQPGAGLNPGGVFPEPGGVMFGAPPLP